MARNRLTGIWTKGLFRGSLIADWNSIKSNAIVDGYAAHIYWETVEPTENALDWSAIDNVVDTARSNGKHAVVQVLAGSWTPDWVYTKDPSINQFNFLFDDASEPAFDGNTYPCPYYWEQQYLDEFGVFVDKLAAKYDDNETVPAVWVSGPHNVFLEYWVSTWMRTLLEAEGWTTQKHMDAWEWCIDKYAKAFNNTLVVFRSGPLHNVLANVTPLFDFMAAKHPKKTGTVGINIADNGNIGNESSVFHDYWSAMQDHRENIHPMFNVSEFQMSDGPQWSVADSLADPSAFDSVLDGIRNTYSGVYADIYEGRVLNTEQSHTTVLQEFKDNRPNPY